MNDALDRLCQSHGNYEFCISSMKKGKLDTFTHVDWGRRGLKKIFFGLFFKAVIKFQNTASFMCINSNNVLKIFSFLIII